MRLILLLNQQRFPGTVSLATPFMIDHRLQDLPSFIGFSPDFLPDLSFQPFSAVALIGQPSLIPSCDHQVYIGSTPYVQDIDFSQVIHSLTLGDKIGTN